jgi:ABC-2 type transport system permease protein
MKIIRRVARPAGFLWLFGHELRLLWRGSILVRTRRHVLIPVLAVGVLFQSAALVVAWAAVRQNLSVQALILVANLNLLFLGGLILSRAMTAAIEVLYARGDVDFLLASPIPPRRVLAVRMLGVAAKIASPWLLLGGVLVNALAAFGHVRALAAYLIISAAALLATAAAFSLVVVLVRRIGPRAARTLSHALSLVIGVVIFALGQAPHYVPAPAMARLWHALMPNAANAAGLRWVPGRAMLGEPAPLLVFMAVCALAFWTVLRTLAETFASGAISAAGFVGSTPRRGQTGQFRRSPFAAAMLKNLRLLLRFPGLLTQTVYRSLTLVPVAMILSGRVTIGAGPEIVAPLVVFLAGQLALFFASVMMDAAQSPDFYAAAPVSPRLRGQAVSAAASYATAVIMALPVLGIFLRDSGIFPALLACLTGAAASNLAIALKFPIPLSRAAFGKAATGTVLGLILGVSASTFWAGAVWLIIAPHPFSLV